MVEKCYPDEPISEEIISKTAAYSTNGATLASTYDRKTVSALQEVDSTTMFFLSLAKTVKEMPRQKQSTVKMLCMKIVHDAEMEVDNSVSEGESFSSSVKIISGEDSSPTLRNGEMSGNHDSTNVARICAQPSSHQQANEVNSEHFLYVMSPSRVETMIDISSDDEAPKP